MKLHKSYGILRSVMTDVTDDDVNLMFVMI